MTRVKIKPLSVNEAWQGKRYKTDAYKKYERAVLLMLPKMKIPDGPLKISFTFGFSNVLCDWDNPVKPIQDIMQKKYGFNDKNIHEANVKKVKVPKGHEYFEFEITAINP